MSEGNDGVSVCVCVSEKGTDAISKAFNHLLKSAHGLYCHYERHGWSL